MTRIDMTTREWHELIKPVLPHISTDADSPALAAIRVELAEFAAYAVATDRYTLAAERHPLKPGVRLWDVPEPVHVRAADAAASLRLFGYSKDYDPPLRLTVDSVAVPIRAAGHPTSVKRLAVTVESDDGTHLVLHDLRDPSNDPLASWRKILAGSLHRELHRDDATAASAFRIAAGYLKRWEHATRKGEHLSVYTGSKEGDLILVAVEQHFLGAQKPVVYLEAAGKTLAELPWRDELAEVPEVVRNDGPPPWVKAGHPGKCAGCDDQIAPLDAIQADGDGGWLCRDCGTADDDEPDPGVTRVG